MSSDVAAKEGASLALLYERDLKERRDREYQELTEDARATLKAVKGWHEARTPEEWENTCREAAKDIQSGAFLIEKLGARRFLDPKTMATLLSMRTSLIKEHDPVNAAHMMLIDLAIVPYYNALRMQEWIGNQSLVVERELFGQEPLDLAYGNADGTKIEETIDKLGNQLLALQDRASRMMLRNLKALHELKRSPAPSVSVGNAGQVNIGQQQVNKVES